MIASFVAVNCGANALGKKHESREWRYFEAMRIHQGTWIGIAATVRLGARVKVQGQSDSLKSAGEEVLLQHMIRKHTVRIEVRNISSILRACLRLKTHKEQDQTS